MIDVSPSVIDLLGISRERVPEQTLRLGGDHPPRGSRQGDGRERALGPHRRAVQDGVPRRASGRPHGLGPRGRGADRRRGGAAAPLARPDARRHRADQAQAELHEAKTKYGALVEQIPAIVYVDVADDEHVDDVREPADRGDPRLHRHRSTSTTRSCGRACLHPDDREEAMATYLRGRESGRPLRLRVPPPRARRQDGVVPGQRDRPHRCARACRVHPGSHARHHRAARWPEERIAFLAYHDRLTGLPNRTMFDELLGLALARAKRHDLGVVVVTVDLDDFKLVNDSLGHEAGDAPSRAVRADG